MKSLACSTAVCAVAVLGLLVFCPDSCAQDKKGKKEYRPPAPEILDISQGRIQLCLSGALIFQADARNGGVESGSLGNDQTCGTAWEASAGSWGKQIIQKITNLTPANRELARFGQKDDIEAGEDLHADDTWISPLPATHVKSSSVVLQVPITWTGTGNGTMSELYAQYWDGDTGVYSARVEVCLAPSDHTKLKQVKDKDDKPIKCTTADGVLYREGYWYDVGEPWSTVKYLSLVDKYAYGIPGLPKTTVRDTLSIPIDLPVPVNSLRVEFELGLKDSKCSKNCTEPPGSKKMPVYTNPTASDPYVQSFWGNVSGQNSQGQTTERARGGPEYLVTRFAVQLPSITVLPAAFIQMKVLPYTIVYRPPGDKSQGVYQTTEAYGTSLTTGESTAIDNTGAFQDSMDVKNSMKITAFIGSIEEDYDHSRSDTSAWDNNSTIGTGLVTGNTRTEVRGWTLGSTSGDSTILPAAEFVTPNTCTAANYKTSGCTVVTGESYNQEPFWQDRIVVLLNPAAALWNFHAGTTMQLLGAADYDAISVRDLASCAQSSAKYGWTLSNGSQLTPKECQDLVVLDPYWMAGQSLDPSKSGRGVKIGNGNYGGDPRNPTGAGLNTSFQSVFQYSSAESTNGSASYQTSVTNILGFSWSEGMTLEAKQSPQGLDVGISDGTTVTQGNQSTRGTQMKVTYSASTVATSTTTTQISGSFDDDHDFDTPSCQKNTVKCYSPQVTVYVDELFGGYMFSDPAAPPNPLMRETQPVNVKVPLTGVNQK